MASESNNDSEVDLQKQIKSTSQKFIKLGWYTLTNYNSSKYKSEWTKLTIKQWCYTHTQNKKL